MMFFSNGHPSISTSLCHGQFFIDGVDHFECLCTEETVLSLRCVYHQKQSVDGGWFFFIGLGKKMVMIVGDVCARIGAGLYGIPSGEIALLRQIESCRD